MQFTAHVEYIQRKRKRAIRELTMIETLSATSELLSKLLKEQGGTNIGHQASTSQRPKASAKKPAGKHSNSSSQSSDDK